MYMLFFKHSSVEINGYVFESQR